MPLPLAWRGRLVAALTVGVTLAGAAIDDARWSVRVWRSDEGLPNNQVTSLAQTDDGYLWIGTLGRSVRFDGVTFDAFATKDFAGGRIQRVTSLLATSRGLWAGLNHGPVIFLDGGKPQVITEGLPDRDVLGLVEAGDGTLWVACRAGAAFRIENGRVRPCTAAEGFPAGYSCSLARDNRGRIWFAKKGAVGVFHDGRFESLLRPTAATIRVAPAASGGVWVCAGWELLRCREGQAPESCGRFQPLESTAEPTALLEDRAGAIWIGTSDSGLFHFDGATFSPVPTSQRAITCLFEDREGSLWVGTDGGGVNRIRPRVIQLQSMATGLPFDTVRSVTEDAHGTRWITTQNGWLAHQTATGWQIVTNTPEWPGGRAVSVAADPSGGVWVSTMDFAVHHWDGARYTSWRRADGLVGHTTNAIVVARNGDVWLGEEAPDVLQRIRDGRLQTFSVPIGIRLMRAMAEDRAGDIWVGSSKGVLLRIHHDTVLDETAKVSPDGIFRSIRYLRATPDGKLWIAFADEGLGLGGDHGFMRFGSANGLPDENLSQVVPDSRGWLWIAGDHGLFKVREAELAAAAPGSTVRAQVVRFGEDEGLVSPQANVGQTPGALVAGDGRIWMPLRTGVAVIQPAARREDGVPPPIVLKRVSIDDQPVAWFGGVMPSGRFLDLRRPAPELRLPANHRRIEFEYTALSLAAPNDVRFRYRLEGFDEDWVEAGTHRSVLYSRLPAGDYTFRVKVRNGDGVWSDREASLAFSVAPFVWQTWWFRLSAFAVLLALVVVAVRSILLRRMRRTLTALRQQSALDRERARIARDMHDDLGGRLTQIGLLLELAQRAPPDVRDGRMAKIAATVQQASGSLDEIVWAVNPGNDTLPRLIRFASQYASEFLAAAGISCRFDLPEELPEWALFPDVRHHLFLAIKEALTNIARHSHANEVWIRATIQGEEFTLSIEDNGRGFTSVPDDGCADGVGNMRQRMEDIGGRLDVRSDPGKGTRIVMIFSRTAAASQLSSRLPRAVLG